MIYDFTEKMATNKQEEQYFVKSLLCEKGHELPMPPLLYLLGMSYAISPRILCNLDTESFLNLLQAFPEMEDGETEICLHNLATIWHGCQAQTGFVPMFHDYLKIVIHYHVAVARLNTAQDRMDQGLMEGEDRNLALRNLPLFNVPTWEARARVAREKVMEENHKLRQLKDTLHTLKQKRNKSVGYEKHSLSFTYWPKLNSELWFNVNFTHPEWSGGGSGNCFMVGVNVLYDEENSQVS